MLTNKDDQRHEEDVPTERDALLSKSHPWSTNNHRDGNHDSLSSTSSETTDSCCEPEEDDHSNGLDNDDADQYSPYYGLDIVANQTQALVESVRDSIQGEYQAIAEEMRELLLEELIANNDNKGETEPLFMEMSVCRSSSVLTNDIQQAVLEAAVEASAWERDDFDGKPLLPRTTSDLADRNKSTTVPIHAYLMLASAVVALAATGPSLNMQQGVGSTMKICWRLMGTCFLLFPVAVRSVVKHGLPKLTRSQWCSFAVAAVCYTYSCIAFVIALEYTSVGNCVIFANAQALMLLAGKMLVGDPVLLMEGLGAITAFTGAMLCAFDASASSTSTEIGTNHRSSFFGDFLALVAGSGGVGYLVFAKSVKGNFPCNDTFMFLIVVVSCLLTILFMIVSGQEVTFDMNVSTGLFGFLDPRFDRLPLEVVVVVFSNILGCMGYLRSMKYFDNLVISVATLSEPVVASFLAYFLQVGNLPHALGWAGNALVAGGTIAVVYPSVTKDK